ncbi:MAG: hypothetical protein NDJ89_06325 [Oligoflexia bacterium]|nr:hypothetical protein [Oligoflexia bacterium]
MLGQLIDSDEPDLMILEIPADEETTPFADYDRKSRKFIANPEVIEAWKDSPDGVFEIPNPNGDASPHSTIIPPWVKDKPVAVLRVTPAHQGSLKVYQRADKDQDYYLNFAGEPDPYGHAETHFPVKFQPGMSGAPIVEEKPRFGGSEFEVIGIATRTLRNRIGSYATHSYQIARTFEDYLRGKRGNPKGITWLSRNGLVYRVFPDGTREINPDTIVTGGPDSAGSGGPDSAGSGGPDSAGSGGPDSAGSGAGGTQKSSKLDLGDPYRTFQISSGFIYKGREAVALKAYVPELRETLYVPGSLDGLSLLKSLRAKSIKPLPADFPITRLLKERVGTKRDAFQITSDSGRSVQYRNGKVRILIQKLGPAQADLTLDLDEAGKLVGSDHKGFVPIVRVKGPRTGTEYSVDLTDLFLTHPDPLQHFNVALPARRGGLASVLTIVNLQSGAEYRIPFAREVLEQTIAAIDELPGALESLQGNRGDCL